MGDLCFGPGWVERVREKKGRSLKQSGAPPLLTSKMHLAMDLGKDSLPVGALSGAWCKGGPEQVGFGFSLLT
jgi:hypothetical protein